MSEPRDLTEIERAVVRILAKPPKIPCDGLQPDFLLRAFADPSELIQAAFNSVDWDLIREHLVPQEPTETTV